MLQRKPHFVRAICAFLERESRLQEKYCALLDVERKAVTESDLAKIAEVTMQRHELSKVIEAARDRRLEYMAGFPHGTETRLSEFLTKHCHQLDAKAVLPLVKKLRKLITRSEARGHEFAHLLNFSINMVHGSLSILWSATQNVFKAYGQNGVLKESYHPTKSRAQEILKQA